MENNEQWLTSGDCRKCRRRSYCHTPCKAHNNSLRQEAIEAGWNIIKKYIGGQEHD